MVQSKEMELVWLITGTSSGFGRRLVLSALARGDRVIASARCLDKIQDLPNLAKDKANNLHLIQLDVTSGGAVIKEKIDKAATVWGRIDVLVNNAGYGLPGIIEEGGTERLKRQFETNVFGLMDVTNAALPYMRAQRSGTLINFGSRSAWKPEIAGLGPYAASKAAVHTLTETWSVELAPFNIRVLLVEPGSFRTEGIYGQEYFTSNPLPDYDDMRIASAARFKSIPGKEKGDPNKAMEALVDIVRGEGIAKGRDPQWPRYLVLGRDAESDIRLKMEIMTRVLDNWGDISRSLEFNN